LQEIFSRNIVLLFSNRKQKKFIYLNNCNLNTINIVKHIFNSNFDILQNTRERKRKKETKQKSSLLFVFRNLLKILYSIEVLY